MMDITNVIGLMSGSSLDGVDLVDVDLWFDGKWHYEIIARECIKYEREWNQNLRDVYCMPPHAIEYYDVEYGKYLGKAVAGFIERHYLNPKLVASHGHTVFHRPSEHYTLQIGNGQAIANECGITVVNDFRIEDVLKGGQGAPLVPVGDKYLFSEYPICLNIGGIANVSYDIDGRRIAYDICIANQALNYISHIINREYDKDGLIARSGCINKIMLEKLNSDAFYLKKCPKSLGKEFFIHNVMNIIDEGRSIPNMMSTFVEHIAIQIGQSVNSLPAGRMLVTGGGAKNIYLVERIKAHTSHDVVIPDNDTIDYKEAVVFAFLGLLRMNNKINVFRSVTGASSDSCSGNIFCPRR